MVKMEISVISLVERHGTVTARARALAPDVSAQIWTKVEFERGEQEPWQAARHRVLAVLDLA
jgi:hypothetical protein